MFIPKGLCGSMKMKSCREIRLKRREREKKIGVAKFMAEI